MRNFACSWVQRARKAVKFCAPITPKVTEGRSAKKKDRCVSNDKKWLATKRSSHRFSRVKEHKKFVHKDVISWHMSSW